MNLNKLKLSVGTHFLLRPIPQKLISGTCEPSDDEWELQEVETKDGTILLSNLRSGHRLRLNNDHIHHYTSAPKQADNVVRGFLELTVVVVLNGDEIQIEPLFSGPARATETLKTMEILQRQLEEAQVAIAIAKARTEKRTLTAQRRMVFLQSLVLFRGQRVSVYYDARDAEAEGYAAILSAALKEAGVGSGDYCSIDCDPRPEGVVVYCSDVRNPSPLPLGLGTGLRAAGVEVEISQAPGWARVDNPNWAGIWVGSRRLD